MLPTLGETDAVVMATPGELFPGVATDEVDEPRLAALKGDLRMVEVIAAAVRERQRTIERPRRLDVDGTIVSLEPAAGAPGPRSGPALGRAAQRGPGRLRRRGPARPGAPAGRRPAAPSSIPRPRADLMALLYESPDVRREVNWCWAPISPQRLLRDLFAESGLPRSGRASR